MSQTGETFFTTIGCMDGRVQEPVAEFGRKKLAAKFADTITEAGLVGALSKKSIDKNLFSSLKQKISISLDKHHSKGIIVHGHQDCAGNSVGDEKHKKDIVKAVEILHMIVPKDTSIIPVFVVREGNTWIVQEFHI